MSGTYRDVPCNGCTACCRGDVVRILPHEDAKRWRTMPHPKIEGALALAHKGGNCVYLTDASCDIHGKQPEMCRSMDCRLLVSSLPRQHVQYLVSIGALQRDVVKRGRELLRRRT